MKRWLRLGLLSMKERKPEGLERAQMPGVWKSWSWTVSFWDVQFPGWERPGGLKDRLRSIDCQSTFIWPPPSVVVSRSSAFLNGSSGLQEQVLFSDRCMLYYDRVSDVTERHFHDTLLAEALTSQPGFKRRGPRSHLLIGGMSKNPCGYILNPSLQ